MASKKIALDKYYTSQELADYCVQKAIDIIGKENLAELIESSAGNGVFLNSFEKLLPDVSYLAYDIEPEDNRIVKQDYLELDMEYKKGRVTIGNPPFGDRGNLYRKFYNKSIDICEYICFIGSIKLLNNTSQCYKYDLIYSEDLGLMNYSNTELRCCFNIYKKPKDGKLNVKKNNKLRSISLYREDEKSYECITEDFKICRMGQRTWYILNNGENLRNFKVVINNLEFKDIIIEKLKCKFNNKNVNNVISTPYISKNDIYKYLKEQIENIE